MRHPTGQHLRHDRHILNILATATGGHDDGLQCLSTRLDLPHAQGRRSPPPSAVSAPTELLKAAMVHHGLRFEFLAACRTEGAW